MHGESVRYGLDHIYYFLRLSFCAASSYSSQLLESSDDDNIRIPKRKECWALTKTFFNLNYLVKHQIQYTMLNATSPMKTYLVPFPR